MKSKFAVTIKPITYFSGSGRVGVSSIKHVIPKGEPCIIWDEASHKDYNAEFLEFESENHSTTHTFSLEIKKTNVFIVGTYYDESEDMCITCPAVADQIKSKDKWIICPILNVIPEDEPIALDPFWLRVMKTYCHPKCPFNFRKSGKPKI